MLSIIEILILSGVIFIASELFIGVQTGFDLVLVGISLIAGGILGSLVNNQILAIITSSILSCLYIFFGRNFVKKQILVLTKKTNIDKLVGQKGIVVRTITPDTAGMVRTSDEDWRALSEDVIYEKEKVVVKSIEGVTLHVTKIK